MTTIAGESIDQSNSGEKSTDEKAKPQRDRREYMRAYYQSRKTELQSRARERYRCHKLQQHPEQPIDPLLADRERPLDWPTPEQWQAMGHAEALHLYLRQVELLLCDSLTQLQQLPGEGDCGQAATVESLPRWIALRQAIAQQLGSTPTVAG